MDGIANVNIDDMSTQLLKSHHGSSYLYTNVLFVSFGASYSWYSIVFCIVVQTNINPT